MSPVAAFGGGSMVAALALPRLLDRFADRPVMLGGAGLLVATMLAGSLAGGYGTLLALWFVVGIGYAATQTPTGRLIRRSSHPEDHPALFAAQFALSHATWLLTYPLAGWLGATAGMQVTFIAMAAIAAFGVFAGTRLWPAGDPIEIEHSHDDLPAGHPHLAGYGHRHIHAFVIDAEHTAWPGR